MSVVSGVAGSSARKEAPTGVAAAQSPTQPLQIENIPLPSLFLPEQRRCCSVDAIRVGMDDDIAQIMTGLKKARGPIAISSGNRSPIASPVSAFCRAGGSPVLMNRVNEALEKDLYLLGCVNKDSLKTLPPEQIAGLRNLLIQVLRNKPAMNVDNKDLPLIVTLSSWEMINSGLHPAFSLKFDTELGRNEFENKMKGCDFAEVSSIPLFNKVFIWPKTETDVFEAHNKLIEIFGSGFEVKKVGMQPTDVDLHKAFPLVFREGAMFSSLANRSREELSRVQRFCNDILPKDQQLTLSAYEAGGLRRSAIYNVGLWS
jgi:hypothetical protein